MSDMSYKIKQPLQAEDSVIVKQISTPANPDSGYNKIYPKSDGKFYNLQSDGTETELGSGSTPPAPVNPLIESIINNNQITAENITDVIVDSAEYRSFAVDYWVDRSVDTPAVSLGNLDVSTTSNASDGNKFASLEIKAISSHTDGSMIIGGSFTNYAGVTGRNYLVKLNANGTLDTTFTTAAVESSKFSHHVWALAVQSNGQILVGGSFTNHAGVTGRSYLVKFNANGTLDSSFNTNAVDSAKFNGTVKSIVIQPNGQILVGGQFTNYGTAGRNRLIRLNSDGTLDTSFSDNTSGSSKFASGNVNAIAIESDGKVLAGGDFITYGGTAGRNRLVRFDSLGVLDTSFCANAVDGSKFANNIIYAVAVDTSGKILAGGSFTAYAGTANRSRLVRLNTDGTTDTSFCTNAVDGAKFNEGVYSITTEIGGKILLGGFFTTYSGTAGRNRLIRLNTDGTLDTAFCTNAVDGTKFNGYIGSINVRSDGKILIGGVFTGYAGTANRNTFIVLDATVASSLELSESGTIRAIYYETTNTWLIGLDGTVGDADIIFDITPSGQVTYTTSNMAGSNYYGEMKCYFISKIEI